MSTETLDAQLKEAYARLKKSADAINAIVRRGNADSSELDRAWAAYNTAYASYQEALVKLMRSDNS